MKISVIMPVYNNLKYLKKSVDSVLNQTFSDFEFVILDDASKEPIWEFLNDEYDDERIVLLRNKKNKGLTVSLNKCLAASKGEIIARQDGDDMSMPDRFEEQAKAFEGFTGLVSTLGEGIDKNDKINYENRFMRELITRPPEKIREQMLNGSKSIVLGPSMMYSREVFEKIGYYDEFFTFSQDYNYWIRAFRFFELKTVQKELYLHRSHKENSRKMMPERYRGLVGEPRRKKIHERAEKYTVIKERGAHC